MPLHSFKKIFRVEKIKMKEGKNLDQKYMNIVKDVKFDPVFILGLHRSGTSILYKMLAETNKFNVVTALHLLKYNELLHNHINKKEKEVKEKLTQYFKELGIGDRDIDNLAITPDFAEEYGFLLTELKYPAKLTIDNIEIFNGLCKKIQFTSKNKKPLMLKNPYDFPNFLFIKKHIPNAKFIFIHRNPIQVLNSSMNAWEIIIKNKNPYTSLLSKGHGKVVNNPLLYYALLFYYGSNFPLASVSVIRNSKIATDYFLENIDKLSKKDYTSIRYEELCDKPNEIIRNILKFLGQKTDKDFSSYIKARNLKLRPPVNFLKEFTKKKMEPYFKRLNYN